MAQLLTATVTLGCISLLYLLPCTLSGRLGGGLRLVRLRDTPIRTPSSGLQPRHHSLWSMVRKPHHASQPQGKASLAPDMSLHLKDHGPQHPGPRRHLASRRPHAQLLRVGCVLGTCQVQNLSHRLWQLVRPGGRVTQHLWTPAAPTVMAEMTPGDSSWSAVSQSQSYS